MVRLYMKLQTKKVIAYTYARITIKYLLLKHVAIVIGEIRIKVTYENGKIQGSSLQNTMN